LLELNWLIIGVISIWLEIIGIRRSKGRYRYAGHDKANNVNERDIG